MTNPYKLSDAAEVNLTQIYAYGLRTWGEAAADRYYYALIDRFEKIAENPYLYPSIDFIKAGYRRSVCGEDSIYYRMNGDTVEIMAILGSQDIDSAL